MAEIGIRFAFPFLVRKFLGNDEAFIGALYCSLEFFKAVISNAQIAIGTSFTCPVTNFLSNAQVLLEVLYCSMKVFEEAISLA